MDRIKKAVDSLIDITHDILTAINSNLDIVLDILTKLALAVMSVKTIVELIFNR